MRQFTQIRFVRHPLTSALLLLAGLGGVLGCTELASPDDVGRGATGGVDVTCPPVDEREEELIADETEISENTTWSCQKTYLLEGTVFVQPGVDLTIEPSTVIKAAEGALLFVQSGAVLNAVGTADAPIVFTSAKPPGEREREDWQGIVLAGDAPGRVTGDPVPGTGVTDSRADYGGTNSSALCGTLEYVRIEFAGGTINDVFRPNGAALKLAGCGSATRLSYVQIHRSSEGLGFFGGSAKVNHLIVSSYGSGEGIEWTEGFQGTLQFIIAQGITSTSVALKGSTAEANPGQAPVSEPVVANATLVAQSIGRPLQRGVLIQSGSAGRVFNAIIGGFGEAMAFESAETFGYPSERLTLDGVVGSGNGEWLGEGTDSVQAGVIGSSVTDINPGIGASSCIGDPTACTGAYDLIEPSFAPTKSVVDTFAINWRDAPNGAAVDGRLDPAGKDFAGALPQNATGSDDWTLGWTSYVAD